MNKFKQLDLLVDILEQNLGSDELEDVCFYLEEYKRLKSKELSRNFKDIKEELINTIEKAIIILEDNPKIKDVNGNTSNQIGLELFMILEDLREVE